VGFSDDGSLQDADLCVLWDDGRGAKVLTDAHVVANGERLAEDAQQDCKNFALQSIGQHGRVTFEFSRKFDTCDDEDYIIEVWTQVHL